jgi:CDP-diacylglycerol--glycerol-3-phosphate 3-phosphatidyltransferase
MIANAVTAARLVLLAPLYLLIVRGDDRSRWMALALFLLAGITDIIDGRLARARGEASAFGAMLDLIADRLLTLTVLAALLAEGSLTGVAAFAAVILVARDLIVAGYSEALPGRLGAQVGPLEKGKITLQFLGLALLIAPQAVRFGRYSQHDLGRALIELAAVVTLVTLVDYSARALRAFRTGPGGDPTV